MLTGDGGTPADGDDIGDLEALRGVRAYPVRVKCATLVWNALSRASPTTRIEGTGHDARRNRLHSPRPRASDELIRAALSEVYDPEIGIDIVSLGLIYGTNIDDDGLLTIDMTLTTPYCPLGPIIETQAHAVCAPLPGVRDVHVNLVWTPPWDPRTMASDEAQLELGIY